MQMQTQNKQSQKIYTKQKKLSANNNLNYNSLIFKTTASYCDIATCGTQVQTKKQN